MQKGERTGLVYCLECGKIVKMILTIDMPPATASHHGCSLSPLREVQTSVRRNRRSKHGGHHAPCPLAPPTLFKSHPLLCGPRICRLARIGSATLQSPCRWLPRAVVIGLASTVVPTGTEHHKRVPRTSILPLKQKRCPSARWLHKSEPDVLFAPTSLQLFFNHVWGGINRRIWV